MLDYREPSVETTEETPRDSEEEKRMLEAPKPKSFVDRLKHFTWVRPQISSHHTLNLRGDSVF